MKTEKLKTGVTYRGIDLWVKFNVSGKYYAATQYEPEEFPTLEITEILVGDVDIFELFSEEQLEEVYKLLVDNSHS